MKVIIIEDEKFNIIKLKKMLSEIDSSIVVEKELGTIKESVNYLKKNTDVDAIFMDIRLGDGLSFEIFSQVKITCPVIFVSAYDEYAVQAFKVNGLDYILKPVDKTDLSNAVERIKNRIQSSDTNSLIKSLLEQINSKQLVYRNRFIINFQDEIKTIQTANIHFITLEDSKTYIHLNDGTNIYLNMTMDDVETQLDPTIFFRANRRCIIHIDSIDKIVNYSVSKLKIIIKSNKEQEIIISREKVPVFKKWIDR
ncbi:DNA-binding response regulator [Chryseobacterium artocarpi]|uniref:DNA-binding response regulator n=1 Tax=Chryseobacterium artocarpi TaxID=1414727 RepID=A0A1B8ZBU1_9FLAO|nr:LytTR family DNA-binding domain-containing protein [Chryseobacterium artocarpi]OCA69092.1 DNA-binding response regulator [Chryseobacterium artocarpi]